VKKVEKVLLNEDVIDKIRALIKNAQDRITQAAGESGGKVRSAFIKDKQLQGPKIAGTVRSALADKIPASMQLAKDDAVNQTDNDADATDAAMYTVASSILGTVIDSLSGAKARLKSSKKSNKAGAAKAAPAQAAQTAQPASVVGMKESHDSLRSLIRQEVQFLLEDDLREFSGGGVPGAALPLGANPADFGFGGPKSQKVRATNTAAIPYSLKRKKGRAKLSSPSTKKRNKK
jgi:hypothetical protein